MGHSEGSPEREVHSNRGLPKGGRKSQINNLTLHLQEPEEQKTRPRASRRKEIIKIRAELKDIEAKTIQKLNKSRSLFFDKINTIYKSLTHQEKKR